MNRSRAILVVTGAAALALTVPASASGGVSDPIATGLAGPLQFDVGHRGQIYVGQSFAGVLTKVRRNGTTVDLLTEAGEVAGVASRRHTVAYTFTGGTEENPVTLLKVRKPNGHVRTVANLQRFEARRNPDAHKTYGFLDLTDECADEVPPEIGGEPYKGIVESHPYAVANARRGWYVADAAGNDILHVSKRGQVRVVKVLPPQKAIVTEEAAEAVGLPACTVGATYAFESVPTDVEVTHHGRLVVSLLPGGPEDPSLGARGAVYLVHPFNRRATRLAGGFLGATNVAVAPGGKVFVAELFGNKISLLNHRRVTTVAEVPSPAGVEYRRGKLYASIDVFGEGSIVRVRR